MKSSFAPDILRSRAMTAVPLPGDGYHCPVLLTETLWALAPAPGPVIVD